MKSWRFFGLDVTQAADPVTLLNLKNGVHAYGSAERITKLHRFFVKRRDRLLDWHFPLDS